MIISGDENNIALWRLAQASKESPLCLPAQVSLSPPPTNHLFATQSKIRSYWRGSGDGKYLTSVCASEVFCCLKMRAIFLSSSKCVLFYLFTAEKKTFREKNFSKILVLQKNIDDDLYFCICNEIHWAPPQVLTPAKIGTTESVDDPTLLG